MIHQNDLSEKVTASLLNTMKSLKINTLIRKSNIRKNGGIGTYEILQTLILLVFQGVNLFRFLESPKGTNLPSKDTYYRFLKEPSYAWRRFLQTLAIHVISTFSTLTSEKRVKVFIIDDSLFSRSRSKNVELLARVFDHTTHRFVKGFNMLTLGWSDGFSFIPLDFVMLSSSNEKNRLQHIDSKIDKRTHGYKRRLEALNSKPECVSEMIDRVLNAGLSADYVLMDSWFTNEPMLKNLILKGLDAIGMVKDMKQKYCYADKWCSLKELRNKLKHSDFNDLIGSINVTTKSGIPVRLVFVKNRNVRKEWLVILSTDQSIDANEIVRIYGMRWGIETFFKSTKSLLKLAKEFQGQSYDMTISHTTIVFTRFILLEWERRHHQDHRTLGGIFYECCDEIRELSLKEALNSLLELFSDLKAMVSKQCTKIIDSQLNQWIQSQPSYIKYLIGDLCCES